MASRVGRKWGLETGSSEELCRGEEDYRPFLDWLGNDEDGIELGRVEHLDVFLEDVREVAPKGSILVLEGKPAADVREFLEEVLLEPDVRIARGTTRPKQDLFYIPATKENIDELLKFTLNHAVPEICDHLVLFKGQQALLWLHDAGDGYVYAHPSLGEGALERVQSRLKRKPR